AESLAQLEFVDEPIWAFSPGLGQARRPVVAGQRLDQRIVQSIEEHERRTDARSLGWIEKGRCDRGVKSNGQLPFRLALCGHAFTQEQARGRNSGRTINRLEEIAPSHLHCRPSEEYYIASLRGRSGPSTDACR